MDSLRSLGIAVANSFAKLFTSVGSREAVDNLYDRFQLWSANLGLFQTGHGSLDWRLRENLNVRSIIRRFLVDLDQNVQQAIVFLPDSDLDLSIPEPLAAEKTREVDFFPGEDELADAGYDCIGTDNSDQAFQLSLEAINNTLEALYRVATQIRNPSHRKFKRREKDFQDLDPETGVDRIKAHGPFDRMFLLELFEPRQKRLDDERPNDQDDVVQSGSLRLSVNAEYLFIRISEAMDLRRRRFSLLKKHRMHMLRDSEVLQIANMEPKKSKEAAQSEYHQSTAYQSATTFPVDKTLFSDLETTVSISEYASNTGTISDDKIVVPPPPQVNSSDKYFECPYCFILCSRKYLEPKVWRTHVLRDLSPYLCTYEICNQADELFTTRREWMAHEDHFHRGKVQCSDQHNQTLLSSPAYHNRLENDDVHNSERTWNRQPSNAGETWLAVSDRDCPICGVSIELTRHLQNHIAAHLERIAIFSLPRSIQFDEDQDQDQTLQAAIQSDSSRRISSLSSLRSFDSGRIEDQRNARRAEEYMRDAAREQLLRPREDELLERERASRPWQKLLVRDIDRQRIEILQKQIEELKSAGGGSGDAAGSALPPFISESEPLGTIRDSGTQFSKSLRELVEKIGHSGGSGNSLDDRGITKIITTNSQQVMGLEIGSIASVFPPIQKNFLYYEYRKDGADWSGDVTMREIPASQTDIEEKARSRNETGTAERQLRLMGPNRRARIDGFIKTINAREGSDTCWEAAYINNTETSSKDNIMEVEAFEVIFARKHLYRVPDDEHHSGSEASETDIDE